MSTLWAAQGHRTIEGAFMEGSLTVYQGDHFPPPFWFPRERFSFDTPGPFLYSLLAPLFTEEADSHWSSFLGEFSFTFSTPSVGADGCTRIQAGGREDGQSILAFMGGYALPRLSCS